MFWSPISQLNSAITTKFDNANLYSASFAVGRLGRNNFKLHLGLVFMVKI